MAINYSQHMTTLATPVSSAQDQRESVSRTAVNSENARLAERGMVVREKAAETGAVSAHASFMNALSTRATLEGDQAQQAIGIHSELLTIANVANNLYKSNLDAGLSEKEARKGPEAYINQWNKTLGPSGFPGIPTGENGPAYWDAMAQAEITPTAPAANQKISLVNRGTGLPHAGYFDPNTGKNYLSDGTLASGDEYFAMPASATMEGFGPTATQRTELTVRRDQLNQGIDLIKTILDPQTGVPGTAFRGANKILGIADDILDVVSVGYFDAAVSGARKIALSMVSAGEMGNYVDGEWEALSGEESAEIFAQLFRETLATTELLEFSLGLTLARSYIPTGRIPVELIRLSISNVQLTGFNSRQEVMARMNFLASRFQEGIQSIDTILGTFSPGEDQEWLDMLKEAEGLGIDISQYSK